MSAYTDALAELVALQGRLDRQLAQAAEQVAAERRRAEQEIEQHTGEHQAVLDRLEATLARARAAGIPVGGATAGEPVRVGADPIDQASQLVAHLDDALEQVLHTRKSLAAEEATLAEQERQRAEEERRRREREGLRRDEAWERARQGSNGLLAGLAVFAIAGLVGGLVGLAATLALPLLAAGFAWALHAAVTSTLPALAVQRASGVRPELPEAPRRESRLAAGAYTGAALAAAGLGALVASLATGATLSVTLLASASTVSGIAVTVCIWIVLPRSR